MDIKEIETNVMCAMVVCLGHNVKVYPIVTTDRFHQIQVSFADGSLKTYEKVLKRKEEVNEAMVKTYIHHAKLILKQLEDAKQTDCKTESLPGKNSAA